MEKFLQQLDKLDLPIDQYVIIGSGALNARNIRQAHDLDILVTLDLWEKLRKKYPLTKTDPVENIDIGDLQIIGHGSKYRDNTIATIEEMISTADTIQGHKFLNLDLLKTFKLKESRDKDLVDVELINKHLAKIPKLTSSSTVYSNKYLDIKVDEVELNGHKWEYAYFIKPNENAVTILPVENNGIYLVEQYRYPNKSYFWQIPMGMIDIGATPEATAIKELKEEAGITAGKLTKIGTIVAEPGMSNQKTIVYVAEDLIQGKKETEYNEIGMKLKHFSFEQISKMIKDGQLTCGFTLSSIFLLKNNYLPNA